MFLPLGRYQLPPGTDQLRRQRVAPDDTCSGGLTVAQRVVDETARRRWMPWSLYLALGFYWAGTAYLYRGWNLWLHVGAAALYLAMAAVGIRERRRLLASAERLSIRPRATPRRLQRRSARFRP